MDIKINNYIILRQRLHLSLINIRLQYQTFVKLSYSVLLDINAARHNKNLVVSRVDQLQRQAAINTYVSCLCFS